MKPDEFIDTAAHLLLTGRREGDWRSSISRGYYGVYWMISEEILRIIPLLTLQNCSLCLAKNHISHERLPNALRNSTSSDLKKFGEQLEKLRAARIEADYRLEQVVTKAKAADIYERAAELKAELVRFGIAKLAKTLKSELEGGQRPSSK